MESKCCYLTCEHAAEWQIWTGSGPDDYTEACTQHVGELLSAAPEHMITPITPVPRR